MTDNDRYMENVETVRKIAHEFGILLTSFDPGWRFSILKKGSKNSIPVETTSGSYDVPDDFMGKLALLMSYPWAFESTDEELIQKIKDIEHSIETHPYNKEPPKLSHDQFPEEAEELNAKTQGMYNQALEQFKTHLNDTKEHYKKLLCVRSNLRNNFKKFK